MADIYDVSYEELTTLHQLHRRFCDIYPDANTFSTDYKASQLYVDTNNRINDTNINNLYYLLYSRYGNNTIIMSDETRFKYNVYSIIFQYGPAWERELNLQQTIRNMSDAQLQDGAEMIYNHAYNPSQAPATDAYEALTYTNEQTAQKHKKGRIEAYNALAMLLQRDVTGEFIDKFKKLFSKFELQVPIYITELQ